MKRLFLIPLIFLICFFAVFVFVLPKLTEVSFLEKQIEKAKEAFTEKQKVLTELQTIQEKLQENQENIVKIESALPMEFSLPDLFDYLQTEVEKSGLLLKNISEQQVGQQTQNAQKQAGADRDNINSASDILPAREHLIGLDVLGTVGSLQSFIESISKSSRLIFLEALSTGVSDGEMPTFSLLLKTYSRER